ncbi:MAG: hypothetical protein M1150_01455 [Patescibacteria group bacterium]|nr:hypothetical protein [Patescibacteria group bacterium]
MKHLVIWEAIIVNILFVVLAYNYVQVNEELAFNQHQLRQYVEDSRQWQAIHAGRYERDMSQWVNKELDFWANYLESTHSTQFFRQPKSNQDVIFLMTYALNATQTFQQGSPELTKKVSRIVSRYEDNYSLLDERSKKMLENFEAKLRK